MKTIKKISGCLVFILSLFTFAGCGGDDDGDTTPPVQPTKAVLTLSTSGTLASDSKIGGIDVSVDLPSGVTVKATPDSENSSVLVTDDGVVEASGIAAGVHTSTIATYTAAASFTAGKVVIKIVNADGFGTGEFATINCDIAAGGNPTAEDFSLSGFSAVDLNGSVITGVTAEFTADIQ